VLKDTPKNINLQKKKRELLNISEKSMMQLDCKIFLGLKDMCNGKGAFSKEVCCTQIQHEA